MRRVTEPWQRKYPEEAGVLVVYMTVPFFIEMRLKDLRHFLMYGSKSLPGTSEDSSLKYGID